MRREKQSRLINLNVKCQILKHNCQIHLLGLSNEKESNNDSIGSWNDEKGEVVEVDKLKC